MCKNFPTPHCHSAASLDSASTPENFAAWEVEHGTGALTVTDHGTMAGARKVYDLAVGKKFKGKLTPIIGLEAYFRDDDCPILKSFGIETVTQYKHKGGKVVNQEEWAAYGQETQKGWVPFKSTANYQKYFHLTMHFQDQKAYEAGIRVLSRADARAELHGSERKPLFSWLDLEELGAENITFGSGCLVGMVQRHLAFGERADIATAYYERLRSIVKPGNFWVETFPHVCDTDWTSEVIISLADGSTQNFPAWKKILTDKKYGKTEGINAEELAQLWARSPDGHGNLNAVMQKRNWSDFPEKKKITNVLFQEGFFKNECSVFAPDADLQAPCNRFVMELAAKHGDKVIISDDSHFVTPDEKIIQDVKLMQNGNWRFANSYHRKSGDEAAVYYRQVLGMSDAEVEALADNNHAWASGFKDFKLVNRPSLPTRFYPENTLAHIWKLVQTHGRQAVLKKPDYAARLRAEVQLLHLNGTIDLLPYFMIDEEVCSVYSDHGELTGPGRGSAAGLLLAWLLEITHVDPLRYGLSLDRFLTLDRIKTGKLPDIDQDLPHRDLLVDPVDSSKGWLRDRFGDCVAQISTDRSIRLKSAILDVHRVLSPDRRVSPEVAALAHSMPSPPQGIEDWDFVFGYDNNGEWVEGILTTEPKLMQYVREFPKEWETVQKCMGIPAGKGRHACAFVIANDPISSFIPTMTVSDTLVTQPSAEQVESSGGLKMDFLNVNGLKFIGGAIKLIQERHAPMCLCCCKRPATREAVLREVTWNRVCETCLPKTSDPASYMEPDGRQLPQGFQKMEIGGLQVPGHRVVPVPGGGGFADIWDLPEDQRVFYDIVEGRTESVFQFGTPGAKKWLRHFNHKRTTIKGVVHKALDSIETLAAFTALDRPGPLDAIVKDEEGNGHNMLVEFARRARGETPIGSFPILDKLFPETYGVITYQEQVQRAFLEIGQTTAIQANDFRVHVSKKQMKEIIADKQIFMPGAIKSVGEAQADQLWRSMETFGQYAFNKSHAVCYVIIGYACAWLKHHYPLEWWTAVLCHAEKDKIEGEFWRYVGPLIDLPDVQLSSDRYQIVNERIRAPLNLLKGLGDMAHAELQKYQPIASARDLCEKVEARRLAEGEDVVKTKETKRLGIQKFTVRKKARTALHSGIINALIASGAMDSLLPEDVREGSVAQKISAYIEIEADAVPGSRLKKTGQAKKKVPEQFRNLTALQQYQLRKMTLPAYSTGLNDYIPRDEVCNSNDGNQQVLAWRRGKDEYHFMSREGLAFWSPQRPGKWERGRTIMAASMAYVIDQEVKPYHQTKERCQLTLDIEGLRLILVRWPNDDGKLDKFWTQNLKGAVLLVGLRKWSPEKDFSIGDAVIVAAPLELKKAEKENEDE